MEHSYFVTLTPYEPLSLDDIEEQFSCIGIQKYLVCYEEASRPHFHACLYTQRSAENLKYQLKSKINGRVHISGKDIENKISAYAYTLKDGLFRSKGINFLDIMTAKAKSHPKIKFDDELKVLMDDQVSSISELAKKLIDLHVKCKRKIYRQHLKAIMDTIRVRRCSTYRQELEKYIIDDY